MWIAKAVAILLAVGVLGTISKLIGSGEPAVHQDFLLVQGRRVPLQVARHPRARRYLLRLRSDGSARLTVPRRGSMADARQFAERHIDWLAGQLEKLSKRPVVSQEWRVGSLIMFRGEMITLMENPDASGTVRFGNEIIKVSRMDGNLKSSVVKHLWTLAARELPSRTFELAATHQVMIQRVTVRNQRSRWGSCSRRGTISLNWRLIQAPPSVRDYIILHELMHRRQMNHSARFWAEVASVCPEYPSAEKWLKQHSTLLK